jgi:glucose-6-phosphate isomerase
MPPLRFDYHRSMARPAGRSDPAAGLTAEHGITEADLAGLAEPLDRAVRETVDERCLCSLRPANVEKRRGQGYDIDASFLDVPAALLDEHAGRRPVIPVPTRLQAVLDVAAEVRARVAAGEVDAFVVLGIGGSYLGASALLNAFTHPFHNELPVDRRAGCPRIYFAGATLDPADHSALLDRLGTGRFILNVISKSGTTFETAAGYRVLRKALLDRGVKADELSRFIIGVTGTGGSSVLQKLAAEPHKEMRLLLMPEHVGGRFSVFTPVGLTAAAVGGLDVLSLLRGAAEMSERCLSPDPTDNPAAQYAAAHVALYRKGCHIRVLSVWQKRFEALGWWYDQLCAESLGKRGLGPTPLTGVNTRDLHSRGQQHQQGLYNRAITNLVVERDEPTFYAGTDNPCRLPATLELPGVPQDLVEKEGLDGYRRLVGKGLDVFNKAARDGTNAAYRDDDRPTADIILPDAGERPIGGLMQMLMIATVLEGKLLGINPYGQPGVEAYKRNMMQRLKG